MRKPLEKTWICSAYINEERKKSIQVEVDGSTYITN